MPGNEAYLHAAYVVAGVIYLGYVLALVRRRRALGRRDAEGR